jgi:hypothetical protein
MSREKMRGKGEFTDYLRELARNGYVLERGRANHWKVYRCDGTVHSGHCRDCRLITVTSSTPSDVRALRNLKAHIKRDARNESDGHPGQVRVQVDEQYERTGMDTGEGAPWVHGRP